MVEYLPPEERIRQELEAARQRDAAYLKRRLATRILLFGLGAGAGVLLAGVPALAGHITWWAALLLVLASALVLWWSSMANLGLVASMLLYPGVLVPVIIWLLVHGAIRCGTDAAFAMILLVLVAMAAAYLGGWMRDADPH